MAIVVVNPPAEEPVTASEVKEHLFIEHSEDDVWLDGTITSVREHVEQYLNRKLVTQTIDVLFDCFPRKLFRVGADPIQSIESITYFDVDGQQQTLDQSNYFFDGNTLLGRLQAAEQWPLTQSRINAVAIRCVVGFGDDKVNIPKPIILAIKMIVGHYYENREDSSPIQIREIPKGAEYLLEPLRIPVI